MPPRLGGVTRTQGCQGSQTFPSGASLAVCAWRRTTSLQRCTRPAAEPLAKSELRRMGEMGTFWGGGRGAPRMTSTRWQKLNQIFSWVVPECEWAGTFPWNGGGKEARSGSPASRSTPVHSTSCQDRRLCGKVHPKIRLQEPRQVPRPPPSRPTLPRPQGAPRRLDRWGGEGGVASHPAPLCILPPKARNTDHGLLQILPSHLHSPRRKDFGSPLGSKGAPSQISRHLHQVHVVAPRVEPPCLTMP